MLQTNNNLSIIFSLIFFQLFIKIIGNNHFMFYFIGFYTKMRQIKISLGLIIYFRYSLNLPFNKKQRADCKLEA